MNEKMYKLTFTLVIIVFVIITMLIWSGEGNGSPSLQSLLPTKANEFRNEGNGWKSFSLPSGRYMIYQDDRSTIVKL